LKKKWRAEKNKKIFAAVIEIIKPARFITPELSVKIYSVGFNTSPLVATLFFVLALVFEAPARPQCVEVRP